jgi:RNA recognition motif-containing protein
LDLIEELNLILRDERLKREKEVAQSKDKSVKSTVNPEIEEEDAEKVQEKKPVKKMLKNFILSSIVVIDKDTKRSKQFAFVDFSSSEAA